MQDLHWSTSWVILTSDINCCIFQEAFSLLAYTDPWSSPVGYLLDPVQREPICSSLNSAILGKRKTFIIYLHQFLKASAF